MKKLNILLYSSMVIVPSALLISIFFFGYYFAKTHFKSVEMENFSLNKRNDKLEANLYKCLNYESKEDDIELLNKYNTCNNDLKNCKTSYDLYFSKIEELELPKLYKVIEEQRDIIAKLDKQLKQGIIKRTLSKWL